MARLEVDKPVVCKRIVKVLINSFFPKDVTEKMLLDRTSHLVRENREASRKFFLHSTDELPIELAVKFMVVIMSGMQYWIKKTSRGEERRMGNGNARKRRQLYNSSNSTTLLEEEEEEAANAVSDMSLSSVGSASSSSSVEPHQNHPFWDTNILGGFIDILCVLWWTRGRELYQERYDALRSSLENVAERSVTRFFVQFRNTPLIGGVVYLASFLSRGSADHVTTFCMSKVRTDPEFQTYVDALCNWRRCDDLMELIHEWIRDSLLGGNKPQRWKKST